MHLWILLLQMQEGFCQAGIVQYVGRSIVFSRQPVRDFRDLLQVGERRAGDLNRHAVFAVRVGDVVQRERLDVALCGLSRRLSLLAHGVSLPFAVIKPALNGAKPMRGA